MGSSTTAVRGSSDGRSSTALAGALTNAWFEMTVPSMTSSLTRTMNTSVAAVCASGVRSAGITPGVGVEGVDSAMPFVNGDAPPGAPATGAPFSVVLPAT